MNSVQMVILNNKFEQHKRNRKRKVTVFVIGVIVFIIGLAVSLLLRNYSGRQNELKNGGQEPRSSLFGEPSMAAFNASKRLFFCLRIVDR